MKKTCKIRIFIVAVILALTTVIPLFFTACNEESNGNIYINLDYKIYEYDTETETSTLLNDRKIKVGQYYRVVFDVTFDDLKATVQDDTVNMEMTVNMGSYDNEYNTAKLLDSFAVSNGGYSFGKVENKEGVFSTAFSVDKYRIPDFSKCDFFIILRSLGADGSSLSVENMSVEFEITDPKTTRKVYIYNANDKDGKAWYTVSLLPGPGTINFSKDNIGASFNGINSIEVRVPLNCVNITADIYYDESKNTGGIYGSKTYEESEFTGTGTNQKLTINFTQLMLELIGEEIYYLLLEEASPSVYVVLTADGGKNYSSASFGFTQQLRG